MNIIEQTPLVSFQTELSNILVSDQGFQSFWVSTPSHDEILHIASFVNSWSKSLQELLILISANRNSNPKSIPLFRKDTTSSSDKSDFIVNHQSTRDSCWSCFFRCWWRIQIISIRAIQRLRPIEQIFWNLWDAISDVWKRKPLESF